MSASTGRIYLDHNASAPLLPEAREAVLRALYAVANPSSVHREGRDARRIVEDAREAVAALAGAAPEGVTLSSGASEAASTCLAPRWLVAGQPTEIARAAVLSTDHPATRSGGRFPEHRVTRLEVDADGVISFPALGRWIDSLAPGETAILALGLANGETGVVQPAAEIAARLAGRAVLFVLDAAQAVGRMDCRLEALGADAVLLSGHKIGAMQGIGATALRGEETRPLPLVRGGGQQKGRRGGTEPVALIASLGAAARVVASQDMAHVRALRDRLEARVVAQAPDAVVVGSGAALRLANTASIHHPALKADTAQIALDLSGIAVSSGSACSSGKVAPSDALAAMAAAGLGIDPALGAIRVSLGLSTSEAEVDAFAERYLALVARAVGSGRDRRAA